jgi:hypothetical protein
MGECVAPWNRGTMMKPGIWGFYVVSNYLGVCLCALLMWSVWRNPRKTATDILVAGLCSGCLWMSLTCGTQCLISWVVDCFFGGALACQLEAFFHVSAILTQFFCVAAIAVRAYILVVHGYNLSLRQAGVLVGVIWFVCTVTTILLSLVSPIYLMSAGTYCFFAFGSPAIAGWLVPGLVLAIAVMVFCYVQIYRAARQNATDIRPYQAAAEPDLLRGAEPEGAVGAEPAQDQPYYSSNGKDSNNERVGSTPTAPNPGATTKGGDGAAAASAELSVEAEAGRPFRARSGGLGSVSSDMLPLMVARHCALFLAVLILGWAFAAVAALYELTVGEASQWLVTAVGVGGVQHSIWVPLTYAYTSDFHRRTMLGVFRRLTCRSPIDAYVTAAAESRFRVRPGPRKLPPQRKRETARSGALRSLNPPSLNAPTATGQSSDQTPTNSGAATGTPAAASASATKGEAVFAATSRDDRGLAAGGATLESRATWPPAGAVASQSAQSAPPPALPVYAGEEVYEPDTPPHHPTPAVERAARRAPFQLPPRLDLPQLPTNPAPTATAGPAASDKRQSSSPTSSKSSAPSDPPTPPPASVGLRLAFRLPANRIYRGTASAKGALAGMAEEAPALTVVVQPPSGSPTSPPPPPPPPPPSARSNPGGSPPSRLTSAGSGANQSPPAQERLQAGSSSSDLNPAASSPPS